MKQAWISFCYEGNYYSLYKQWGTLELTGERIVELLRQHPDPAEWIALLRNATFIRFTSRKLPVPIIEALRQYALSGQDPELRMKSFLGIMTCQAHDVHPKNYFKALKAIVDDPLHFREFVRNEAVDNKIPINPNGWSWLCADIENYHRLHFRFLELGFFVFSEEHSSSPPELDPTMEYVYIINLDLGTFSVSTHHAPSQLTFKMGSIPWNWRRCLMLPEPLVELAFAYTPPVKKLMLRELDGNTLWRLVLERIAGGRSFTECLGLLEAVQGYMFNRELVDEKLVQALYKETVIKLGMEQLLIFVSDDENDDASVESSAGSGSLRALEEQLRLHPWIPSAFKQNLCVEPGVFETVNGAEGDGDDGTVDPPAAKKRRE